MSLGLSVSRDLQVFRLIDQVALSQAESLTGFALPGELAPIGTTWGVPIRRVLKILELHTESFVGGYILGERWDN